MDSATLAAKPRVARPERVAMANIGTAGTRAIDRSGLQIVHLF